MQDKEIVINMVTEPYTSGRRVYTYAANEYDLNFVTGFVVLQHKKTGNQEFIQANRVRCIEVKDG
jgi:hypothetical protein